MCTACLGHLVDLKVHISTCSTKRQQRAAVHHPYLPNGKRILGTGESFSRLNLIEFSTMNESRCQENMPEGMGNFEFSR